MAQRSAGALARSEEAANLSFAAAVVALLGSLTVLAFMLRSISRPLRALVAGTRAVSAGDFSVRLDVRSRDELAQLAGSFNAMVDELEQLDRLKSAFVSHISHEVASTGFWKVHALQAFSISIPTGVSARELGRDESVMFPPRIVPLNP